MRLLKRYGLIVLCLVHTVVPSKSGAQQTSLSYQGPLFEVAYPAGWTVQKFDSGATFLAPGEDFSTFGILLQHVSVAGTTFSNDLQFVKYVDAYIRQRFNFEAESPLGRWFHRYSGEFNAPVGDETGAEMQYQLYTPGTSRVQIVFKVMAVPRRNGFFLMMLSTSLANWEKGLSVYRQFLNDVTFFLDEDRLVPKPSLIGTWQTWEIMSPGARPYNRILLTFRNDGSYSCNGGGLEYPIQAYRRSGTYKVTGGRIQLSNKEEPARFRLEATRLNILGGSLKGSYERTSSAVLPVPADEERERPQPLAGQGERKNWVVLTCVLLAALALYHVANRKNGLHNRHANVAAGPAMGSDAVQSAVRKCSVCGVTLKVPSGHDGAVRCPNEHYFWVRT